MKSTSRKKIYWLTNHFTYYHDYLFENLQKDTDLELLVCYRQMILESHPWKDVGGSTYKFTELRKYLFGLDIHILWKALFSKEHFVIAGWDNFMYLTVISILAIRNRPFGIFSDTPRNFQQSYKQTIKKKWLSYVFRKHAKARFLVTGRIGVQRAIEILGIEVSKVVNFPFSTNNEIFSPVTSAPGQIQKQIIRFLSVGRIDFDHKGQDVALRALAMLLNEGYAEFKYIVAGVGGDEDKFDKLVEELGLQRHVQKLGWVEINELPRLFNESHFTLHTSHEDPFPNAVLESLSCGIPVIGSDAAGSVVERVIPKVNGYIFRDSDLIGLQKILIDVLNLKDLEYQELKHNSRKSALQWTAKYNVNVIKTLFSTTYGINRQSLE